MPHILLCDGRCSLARGSMHPPIQFTPQEGFDSDTSFDWAFRDPVATKGFSASLYMPVRGVAWPTAFGEEIESDDKDLLMGEMALQTLRTWKFHMNIHKTRVDNSVEISTDYLWNMTLVSTVILWISHTNILDITIHSSDKSTEADCILHNMPTIYT